MVVERQVTDERWIGGSDQPEDIREWSWPAEKWTPVKPR
jgi:hypothetical protein